MDNEDKFVKEEFYNLIGLKDTGLKPGELLKMVRELYNITLDDCADAFNVTPTELKDIEECRAPFPTIFLMCIFNYGLPGFYNS